ncbi:MAG: dienelactone hydrolase family protein [Gammaproteobacteria bacterium]|nr:dienelactone hydrolase family protein [Gammaproteobacteria bacterium]
MTYPLNPVVLDAPGKHTATVIWMHGLGADGNDFVPVVPMLGLPADHGIKFIFPNAPQRPVTINGGMVMPAWYDILGLDFGSRQDEEGIRGSQTEIEKLIAAAKAEGIPADRIVIAGFSQGGVIALQTSLRHEEKLAGVLALSTYLALHEKLEDEANAANQNTPIFMAHGNYDPVIPFRYAEQSRDRLKQAGYEVEWHSYPMEHQVALEEINDIGNWLKKQLP